ncbi:MAG: hypothetical protein WDM81_00345 [Rhizomicrobium sp.]
MTAEQRKVDGPLLNGLRDQVAAAIAARKAELGDAALNARLAQEKIDVTLPPRPNPQGSIHPVSQVFDEITTILGDLGFTVGEGPDVEYDDYNFTKLNIPPRSPGAADAGHLLSRPAGRRQPAHSANPYLAGAGAHHAQAEAADPRRGPGRTYRVDSDATHSPMFHQFELLVIDKDIHLGHLKWTIEEFCKAFFEVDKVELQGAAQLLSLHRTLGRMGPALRPLRSGQDHLRPGQ